MRAFLKAFAAGLLILAANSGVASAATLTTFDLRGSGGLATSYAFSAGGIDLTVTAGIFTNGGSVSGGASVGQYSNGLGVTSSRHDAHYVDGNGANDVLIFSFEQPIRLHSVTFAYNDSNDDFRFFFDGGSNTPTDWGSNTDIPGSSFYSTYVFELEWIGELFGVGARGSNDEFKVKAVTVEDIPPVPLPAGILLLGSALAMLAAARRRAATA